MATANINLSKKTTRDELEDRREPYWQMLATGEYIGYRVGSGRWLARIRDRNGKQQFGKLGKHPDFDSAKRAADAWLATMRTTLGGDTPKRGTVREALKAYLDYLQDQGRSTRNIERKMISCIGTIQKVSEDDDRILNMQLEATTSHDWHNWRRRLRERGTCNNQTINRYVTCVVAGLNRAIKKPLNCVGNREAWTLEPLPKEYADGEAAVYLTAEQRARIIKHAAPYLKLFLRAMEATGARPHEIANAFVRDYNRDTHTLTLRWMKGKPAKIRARLVKLEAHDRDLFKELTRDKLPGASLITRPSGKNVMSDLSHDFNDAVRAANAAAQEGDEYIPVLNKETKQYGAVAYSFRHGRISELLQVYGLDSVTVARMCGTSVAMIEKYYWKFIPDSVQAKFDAVAERRALRA